jgi:hypothetical protein
MKLGDPRAYFARAAKPWIWDHEIVLETDSVIHPVERRIFRSVRAAIVYDRSEIFGSELSSVENLYRPINVELLPVEVLAHASADDFDVLGILGQKALKGSGLFLEAFTCLKIGFYSAGERPEHSMGSMGVLKAAISCLGSKTLLDSLRTAMFHFYESLTLPSLLNIDLADVGSIARGIGISFNVSGNSSENVISRLPPQCYFARSALLHFTCEKDVTLEEVYKISKTVSTRKTLGPFVSEVPNPDQIKMYKRIRLKMGLRIAPDSDKNDRRPRISLTGILFGIQGKFTSQ